MARKMSGNEVLKTRVQCMYVVIVYLFLPDSVTFFLLFAVRVTSSTILFITAVINILKSIYFQHFKAVNIFTEYFNVNDKHRPIFIY